MRRLLLTAAIAGAALTVMTETALAGGSWWPFDGYHQPGDVVESTTSVAWSHNSDLGIPADGPYLIYLARSDVAPESALPEQSLLVGIVEIHLGPFTAEDGQSYGPHHAVARFEIPDVAPGIYQIAHCNDPCTKTLGDIMGGWDLRVSRGSNGRPADQIAAEVRSRLPTAPLVMPEETSTEVGPAPEPAEARLADTEAAPANRQPIRFDGLWLVMAGLVGLMLMIRMVHAESRWARRPAIDHISRERGPVERCIDR